MVHRSHSYCQASEKLTAALIEGFTWGDEKPERRFWSVPRGATFHQQVQLFATWLQGPQHGWDGMGHSENIYTKGIGRCYTQELLVVES